MSTVGTLSEAVVSPPEDIATKPQKVSKRDQILTRCDIEARIAEGEIIVIYHGRALKLNNWIERHPGGDLVMSHKIGRDASDEMDVYHSDETLKTVGAYQIGRVSLPWKNFTPPIQGGKFRTKEELDLDEGVALSDADSVISVTPTDPGPTMSAKEKIIHDYEQARTAEDLLKYPDLDYETQKNIVEKFRSLHSELRQEGYFQCTYWGYVREFSRISTLFTLAWYVFDTGSKWWIFLSSCFLGLAWHQLTFIAHDAGHLGITHNYIIDNSIGAFIADYMGGLSLGWWKRSHNVHHLVTNDPAHDPDLQHLPFFALSTRHLNNITSTYYNKVIEYDAVAKMMIPLQHYAYYIILCFGRFNLYRLSWEHLLRGLGPKKGKGAWLRYFEIAGMLFFTYWYFYKIIYCSLPTMVDKLIYVMVSHVITAPLHVQITLSHFAMSTSNLGDDESFAQRQIRTTMDVDCPPWLDYVHGGLQFQAIHHLFPRLPRHNLRAAQKKVIKYCNDVGLEYSIYGFTKGNKYVITSLGDIAKQARILAECNKFCQQEMFPGKKVE